MIWYEQKKKRAARLNNNVLHGSKLRFLNFILKDYIRNVNMLVKNNVAMCKRKYIREEHMQGVDARKTGRRMKELCRRRNISVKDIQEDLLIGAFQSIYAWFSGKSLPSLENLYRLSRLLNVPMDWMIVGQQKKYLWDLQCENMVSNFENRDAFDHKEMQGRILIYYMNITNKAAS